MSIVYFVVISIFNLFNGVLPLIKETLSCLQIFHSLTETTYSFLNEKLFLIPLFCWNVKNLFSEYKLLPYKLTR